MQGGGGGGGGWEKLMGGLALNAAFLGAYFLLAYDGGDGGGGGYDGAPTRQHALCLCLGSFLLGPPCACAWDPPLQGPLENHWFSQSAFFQAPSDGGSLAQLVFRVSCEPSLLRFPGLHPLQGRILIVGVEVF